MNRKQKIIVSITGIFIVLLALVGLTYAYFLTRITGNENDKSISVTTANLSVTYNDDMDGDGEPDALMVFENIMPSNTAAYTKTFKVENTGNATATYSVVLDNMVNDFDRNGDLKYTLTREGTTGNVAEGNLVVGTRQILIPKVEIENEGIHTYTLTLKYIEAGVDQSIDMGKELSFRVNIAEETVTWDTAEEGTLLYALKNNQPTGTEETIPGRESSPANEARILEAEDDYGTSYVYRGNVVNNYVTYSNMCWRIVRIQGDGSIKIALADWAHPCGTVNGYSVNDKDSALIADNDGKQLLVSYKGNPTNTIDDIIFANSDIPIALLSWATINNLDNSKLIENEWCNDTSISNIDGDSYIFKSYNRLSKTATENPNLKCNMKGINGTTTTKYINNLGILTADEVVFSGSSNNGSSNFNGYLVINSNPFPNPYTWTMTPAKTMGMFNVWFSVSHSNINNEYNDWLNNDNTDFQGGVRPAIVLQSDVKLDNSIIGQNGGIDTPYVIK